MTTVLHSKDVARFIFSRYDTDRPIGIAKVTNLYNTWLLVLAGTEPTNPKQATWFIEDVSAARDQVDFYNNAIFRALTQTVSPGDSIIIAGHSLGGMEAQNVAADQRFRNYRAVRIITFGSPKTVAPAINLTYNRFAAIGDPIIYSVFWRRFDNSDQTFVGPRQPLGDLTFGIGAHMSYPNLDPLLQYDALGTRNGRIKLVLDPNCYCTFSAPGGYPAICEVLFQRSLTNEPVFSR